MSLPIFVQRREYPFFSNSEGSRFFNIQKKVNWFCNRPLSPVREEHFIAGSMNQSDDDNSIKYNSEADMEIVIDRTESIEDDRDIEKVDADFINTPIYDSDLDPEYFPDSDDSENYSKKTLKESKEINKCAFKTRNDPYLFDFENEHIALEELPSTSKKVLQNVVIQTENPIKEPDNKYDLMSIEEELKIDNTQPSTSKNGTYKRREDMCYFCETDVKNFSRHLFRNHPCEPEVQQILSKNKNSKDRRQLLGLLKKKGNFIKNSIDCVRPVKQALTPNQYYLPCTKCLGFYRATYLYRHRKICLQGQSSKRSQAAGQNFLVKNMKKIDSRLKDEVFPRMRPDKISLHAKNDFLICAFGARYLKIHREKHFINVTSRKMRELSRLLLELKILEPSVINLFDALKPKYYDRFVEATKSVASYDNTNDLFISPTYALNICTSLKQCCDIAIYMIIKTESSVETAECEADLKTLKSLLDSQWRFDISNQAGNDLNLKKFNKITIVPLASDLRLLKEYLISRAEEALKILKKNSHEVTAYNLLLETIYCRVILLNRRRPGELQRMLLHTYVNSGKKNESYEEFNEIVSETEKLLVKNFKRVVIRGKRGRGVPVMFSIDTQNHIKELLDVRSNFVGDNNPYLFGKPGLNTPLYGYKIIAKYAVACGAKNPKAITCTRLRKHLATLTQLFNLNDNEIEQLSTFMGHTTGVHKSSYRLPDDVYQTVKISKLLLLMEKGEAGEHKGKTLDEIPVDMEQSLIIDDDVTSDDDEENDRNDIEKMITVRNEQKHVQKKSPIQNQETKSHKGKKRILVPWTEAQKEVVTKFFSKHIQKKKPPIRSECEELITLNPDLLKNKNWLKIKVFVQNKYTKK